MDSRYRHLISWVIGVAGLIALVGYFQPENFTDTLASVGIQGASAWLLLTMAARLLLVEITVRPIQVLGFRLRRSDAFWIGWIRSFSNQVLPMSGLAWYIHEIRRKVGISWSELAAFIFTPQVILSALAVGIVGMAATLSNFEPLGQAAIPMLLAYMLVSGGAVLFATRSAWLISKLSTRFSARVESIALPFQKLTKEPRLTRQLLLLQFGIILTNGARLWVLFAVTGTQLNWQETFLLAALAESAVLFQVTPGGLGVREGAIVAAAALLQVSPEIGAAVALIDRLFLLATATALATPAVILVRRHQAA